MVSSLCCPTTGQKGLPAGSSDPGPALLTLCNCSSHGGFQAALDPLGAPGGCCPKTLDTASLGASQRSGERREEAHRGEVGRGGQCGADCPLGHLRWSHLRMTSAHWAHRPPPCWFWKAPPAKHGCEPLSPCPVPTPRGPSTTLEGPLVWSQGVGLKAPWSRTHSSGGAWDRPAALSLNPRTPGHSLKGLLAPQICPSSAHTWGLPTCTADLGCPRWGASPGTPAPSPWALVGSRFRGHPAVAPTDNTWR